MTAGELRESVYRLAIEAYGRGTDVSPGALLRLTEACEVVPEFDADNRCRCCGAHIAEPCDPSCEVACEADPTGHPAWALLALTGD